MSYKLRLTAQTSTPTLYGFFLQEIYEYQKARHCFAFCSQALWGGEWNSWRSKWTKLHFWTRHKKQEKGAATDRGCFVSLHSLPLPEVIRSVVLLSGLLHFIPFIVFVIVLCIFLLFFSVRIWRSQSKRVHTRVRKKEHKEQNKLTHEGDY